MSKESIELAPIGRVESPLDDPATAPKQGDEGAPDAWLVLDEGLIEGLDGIGIGDEILVLTWPVLDLKPVLSTDVGER